MEDEEMKEATSMFVEIEHKLFWYHIAYHRDTKVVYAISNDGIFVPLINPDGSPMLYKENNEESEDKKE